MFMSLKNNKLAWGLSCSLLLAGMPAKAGVDGTMLAGIEKVMIAGAAFIGLCGIGIGYALRSHLSAPTSPDKFEQQYEFVQHGNESNHRGQTPCTLRVKCRCERWAELSGHRLQSAVHDSIKHSQGKIIINNLLPDNVRQAVLKTLQGD